MAKQNGFAFVAGLVFALGLGLAGMTQPSKVLGFLDFTGQWDPSLAFVMGAALAVDAVAFALIFRRGKPWLSEHFHVPSAARIDSGLVGGAVLFGVGWGLSGVCPGPALVSLGSLQVEAIVFTAAMVAGMGAFHAWRALRKAPDVGADTAGVASTLAQADG